jgi:hypothetical protein
MELPFVGRCHVGSRKARRSLSRSANPHDTALFAFKPKTRSNNMSRDYFPYDSSATINQHDLETINHYMGKIEEATTALFSISDTLSFLRYVPKETLLHNGLENKGATINGLISAITALSDYIEDSKSYIAKIIREAIEDERTTENH